MTIEFLPPDSELIGPTRKIGDLAKTLIDLQREPGDKGLSRADSGQIAAELVVASLLEVGVIDESVDIQQILFTAQNLAEGAAAPLREQYQIKLDRRLQEAEDRRARQRTKTFLRDRAARRWGHISFNDL